MSQAWTYKDFVKDALTRVAEISCEDLSQGVLAHEKSDPARLSRARRNGWRHSARRGPFSPRGLVEKHIHEHVPDKAARIVVYCSTGNRSALVGDTMQRMGYERVTNLSGGIERWKHLGLPQSGQPISISRRRAESASRSDALCLVPGGKRSWGRRGRSEFAIVGRRVPVLGSGERPLVYLDHAASTHAPESVLSAYVEFVEREYANVHRGTHLLSRKATERFEEAYYVVADYIGAELKDGCVCFCTNTTQAIDIVSHVMAERAGKVITTENGTPFQ